MLCHPSFPEDLIPPPIPPKPSYLVDWEKYVSSTEIQSITKLYPVHDHLFKLLQSLVPTTIVRLSKLHYDNIIPPIYTNINLDGHSAKLLSKVLGEFAQKHSPLKRKDLRYLKTFRMIRSITFMDLASLSNFNKGVCCEFTYGDCKIVFQLINHIHFSPTLIMESAAHRYFTSNHAYHVLRLFYQTFRPKIRKSNLCIHVPKNLREWQFSRKLKERVFNVQHQYDYLKGDKANLDEYPCDALYLYNNGVNEAIWQFPEEAEANWTITYHTENNSVFSTGLDSHRSRYPGEFLVWDLSSLSLQDISNSDFINLVNTIKKNRKDEYRKLYGETLLIIPSEFNDNHTEGSVAQAIEGIPDHVLFCKSESDDDASWICPCGHGRRKPMK